MTDASGADQPPTPPVAPVAPTPPGAPAAPPAAPAAPVPPMQPESMQWAPPATPEAAPPPPPPPPPPPSAVPAAPVAAPPPAAAVPPAPPGMASAGVAVGGAAVAAPVPAVAPVGGPPTPKKNGKGLLIGGIIFMVLGLFGLIGGAVLFFVGSAFDQQATESNRAAATAAAERTQLEESFNADVVKNKVAASVRDAAGQIGTLTERSNDVTSALDAAIVQLNAGDTAGANATVQGQAQGSLDQLRATTNQLGQAVNNLNQVIADLQKNAAGGPAPSGGAPSGVTPKSPQGSNGGTA